jgi:hypothetical protein
MELSPRCVEFLSYLVGTDWAVPAETNRWALLLASVIQRYQITTTAPSFFFIHFLLVTENIAKHVRCFLVY